MTMKLNNFPSIYCVSLKDSIDRQENFKQQFYSYGITEINFIEAYDGRETNFCLENDIVSGLHFTFNNSGAIAATISHLKAIQDWYYNTDTDYAIFFEDDMSIDSIENWNFTWEKLINSLPENWKVIQLSLIKDNITNDDMKLNQRVWWNWSAGCYLIKRDYAKELIEHFYQNNKYFLSIKGDDASIPCIEHCLFLMAAWDAYTLPLFYENINFASTFYLHFIENTHKDHQIESSNYVRYWWKIKGNELPIEYFKI